ncbi:MAG TPA: L-threonylcarbamoyladenylate synthase [Bryobacteraceae bacterium]|jgi:L-threonylcarbamoyladenylate synthase|nr:L-threonylcarbamoyladenylate synthase [Bryobacteraceae bacterium]
MLDHDLVLDLEKAASLLRNGGVVAFPTETVYGLGANALDAAAVERIFAIKERPRSSPLIVHVATIAMAQTVVADWPAIAQTLADRFWPGPLTLVLPKRPDVPGIVTAGLASVGVRMPAHPMALELIERAGVPLAAPSANRFTQVSPTAAEHVRRMLGDRVDMVLDGGPSKVGIESTVVSLTGPEPMVLRPGMITIAALEAATGIPWTALSGEVTSSQSPGLHPRHYSPRTPFLVLPHGAERPEGRGCLLEMPGEPGAFAEMLYSRLHAADAAGWDWIAIEEPPDTPEWTGIHDRLKRASSP